MKKTTTINLGQSIFHIDEDAYELLRQYLDSLKNHFEQCRKKLNFPCTVFIIKNNVTGNILALSLIDC